MDANPNTPWSSLMRTTLLVLLVLVPALAFGQSLAEVAKKEKSRREKNKEEGREVHVISEEDVGAGPAPATTESGGEQSGAARSTPAPSEASSEESLPDGESEEDLNVPAFIPPDAPLPEKLEMFGRMKRQYERQVKEIDEAIAKNDTRLKELEREIASTSALGGAGLPVAPQTGTGAATRPMTGQESVTLVEEQNRLQGANQGLRERKETLKMDLQAKGRAAGIPAGYLRF
jgi:hypothetical protein